jgi:histidine triad (HIT) family protein
VVDCLFCKIALGEIPAQIVYQDDDAVGFRDINPQAPVHVLVIPRRHITGFDAAAEQDEALLGRLTRVVARVAEQEAIADTGFRCVVNSGPDAQQSVPHLHFHVLGGRQMTWPPG